jgi:hypothetical protein
VLGGGFVVLDRAGVGVLGPAGVVAAVDVAGCGVGAALGCVRSKTPAADNPNNPAPATPTTATRKTAQTCRVTDTRMR